ncbi:hypothetical protein [Nocardioides nematodiphilus]|uniref:hypothetical protein n=1 Tax=Nocardioides nematodiphilus TaxID=2849669 RepID=UPI001CD97D38|nr:hypothetical protein [Nocardioides nematodiphilus]MCA1983445.1 hypothetical protein [Nocardioides nematodiphilus]
MKRPATAIAASAALLVGAFVPLAFSNDAQAAPNCTSQLTAYHHSVAHVAKAKKKVKRARKGVAKAVAHRASPRIVRAKRDTVHVKKVDLRFAKMSRNHYYAALLACQKGVTTPQGTAKPVPTGSATAKPTSTSSASATAKPTSTASATATSTTTTSTTTNPLADLLAQLAAAFKAAGAPQQLIDVLTQLQTALSTIPVPAGMDPAAFQKILTDAAAQIQAELAAAGKNPTGVTVQTIVDDIVDPIVAGLTAAGVPTLPGVLTGIENTLDPVLGALGLATLTSAIPMPSGAPALPGASSVPVLGGLLGALAGLGG